MAMAEQLVLEDDVNAEQLLCQAYKTLHEVPSAIGHYEAFVRLAKKKGINPEWIASFEKTLGELKSSLTPVYVTAPMPREYTSADLAKALREKLTEEELIMVTNPLTGTPEMDRRARELTAGATNELQKARMLFDAMTRHIDRGPSSGSRTAREVFAAWDKSGQSFNCQEYANFYVALARAVGLKAFFVSVSEGVDGGKAIHACAGVFIADKLLLVDGSLCWFGVPHKQFTVLDDLQTMGQHLSELNRLAQTRIACKLAPDLSVAQVNLFSFLARANQWQEASEVLTNALRLDPDGPAADAARGLWAFHQGKLQAAAILLQKSIEQDPNQGVISLYLANALLKQDKFREARDVLRKALLCGLLEEDAEQARQTIAQINEKIGND